MHGALIFWRVTAPRPGDTPNPRLTYQARHSRSGGGTGRPLTGFSPDEAPVTHESARPNELTPSVPAVSSTGKSPFRAFVTDWVFASAFAMWVAVTLSALSQDFDYLKSTLTHSAITSYCIALLWSHGRLIQHAKETGKIGRLFIDFVRLTPPAFTFYATVYFTCLISASATSSPGLTLPSFENSLLTSPAASLFMLIVSWSFAVGAIHLSKEAT